MKKNLLLPVFAMAIVTLISCTKNEAPSDEGAATLVASKKDKILIGEPVTFALPENVAGSNVKWTVSPSTSTQVNTAGNKAAILFGQTAKYTITATSGNATASTTVSVTTDTASTETPVTTVVPLNPGETFSVKITAIDTGTSTTNTGMIFYITTKGQYPCSVSRLSTELIKLNAVNYTIKINGMEQVANCSPMYSFPSSISSYHYLTNPWSVVDPLGILIDTMTLSFIVNGTTYTGTIKKTGTKYTINWPDNAVITMPQEVTRVI